MVLLRCRKPTEHELSTFPHIIMTSDVHWNPSVYDNNVDDIEKFYDPDENLIRHDNFDQYGEYRYRTVARHQTSYEDEFFDAVAYADLDDMVDDVTNKVSIDKDSGRLGIHSTDVTMVKPDFQLLRPLNVPLM